jgi:hypothetical protein
VNAIHVAGKGDARSTGSEDVARVPTLWGRKSVLMGIAASVGLAFANATQPSAIAAGTVKPSPISANLPLYASKWAPYTAYALGQQVISPNNDVVAAKVAHTSSAAYAIDTTKWILSTTYGRKSNITVGPGGDYASLAAVFVDYPTGNVDIYINAATLAIPATIAVSGVVNVTISGRDGFGGTTLTCTAGFVTASSSSDAWTIENLNIQHAAGTNTDDGIVVDYPRRWSVRRCTLNGFGGNSIRYRGGLHSEIAFNYIVAKDSTSTNGHAAIWIEKSSGAVVPTTIRTQGNYIAGGKTYGFLCEYCFQISSTGDLAEYCTTGFRFNLCDGELTAPYTESNSGNAIEIFDSAMTLIGRFRDEPTFSWSAVGFTSRYATRVGPTWINPGAAVIFGGNAGGINPETSPSIRCAGGSPEGVYPAVVGSLFLRSDGGASTTLYVKQSGTGNTGWVAK